MFPNQIKLTVSIGVTEYKVFENIETLLTRADKALYTAKENGKDRAFKL